MGPETTVEVKATVKTDKNKHTVTFTATLKPKEAFHPRWAIFQDDVLYAAILEPVHNLAALCERAWEKALDRFQKGEVIQSVALTVDGRNCGTWRPLLERLPRAEFKRLRKEGRLAKTDYWWIKEENNGR